MTYIDDSPIENSEHDLFAFTPFATSIAESVCRMDSPNGNVIAITGPWGCGKSSAINLIRNQVAKDSDDIAIVSLQCLHFHNQDALAAGLIAEIFRGLEKSLGAAPIATKLLDGFLRHSRKIGLVADSIAVALGVPALRIGEILLQSANCNDNVTDDIGNFRTELGDELSKANKRVLVIVDDLDRLTPDEVVPLIKAIKAIGNLPGVIYLLAFDETIVANSIMHVYTGGKTEFDGRQFLEKFVQANFTMPPIGRQALQAMLLDLVFKAINLDLRVLYPDPKRWIDEAMLTEIRTPRDVVRYANALSVTFGAVKGNVHVPDFLTIEAIRLFRPAVFDAIHKNSYRLLVPHPISLGSSDQSELVAAQYDELFLASEPEAERHRLRGVLMRLFPVVEAIWSNIEPHDEDEAIRQRRVCSRRHFDTYFRFSISEFAISDDQVVGIISTLSDSEDNWKSLASLLLSRGPDFANAILEELRVRAAEIPESGIPKILKAAFSVADNLIPPRGESDAYVFDFERIEVLLESLVLERLTLDVRTEIILDAAKFASLSWLVYLAAFSAPRVARVQYGQLDAKPNLTLISESGAERLREIALSSIRNRAKEGLLLEVNRLDLVLLYWSTVSDDGGQEVKSILDNVINADAGVVRVAQAFLLRALKRSSNRIGSRGDQTHLHDDYVNRSNIDSLFDCEKLTRRLEEVKESSQIDPNDLETVKRFLYALKHDSQWIPEA